MLLTDGMLERRGSVVDLNQPLLAFADAHPREVVRALTDAVLAALKTKSWADSLEKNGWTPAVLTGAAFDKFVDDEFASLRATMAKSGMI